MSIRKFTCCLVCFSSFSCASLSPEREHLKGADSLSQIKRRDLQAGAGYERKPDEFSLVEERPFKGLLHQPEISWRSPF
jgi:hypothetical protein